IIWLSESDRVVSLLVVNHPVDDSTRAAHGALRPMRQPGVSRQGRACHPFRGGRDAQQVRQTLSDVRAPIGDVAWGFPDRCAADALRMCIFSFARFIMPTWHSMSGDAGLQAGMERAKVCNLSQNPL